MSAMMKNHLKRKLIREEYGASPWKPKRRLFSSSPRHDNEDSRDSGVFSGDESFNADQLSPRPSKLTSPRLPKLTSPRLPKSPLAVLTDSPKSDGKVKDDDLSTRSLSTTPRESFTTPPETSITPTESSLTPTKRRPLARSAPVTRRRLIHVQSSVNTPLRLTTNNKTLNYDDQNLIGNFSKAYCLPTTTGKQSDLRSISPDTLKHLIDGKYSDYVHDFLIIDCRFPYEYDGGHIRGALNLYTEDAVLDLLETPRPETDDSRRWIIIFHCEFSSERGPKLSRYLRNQDRVKNEDNYPELHYPELYLLEGGYKNFYQQHPLYTMPMKYTTMLDRGHKEEFRRFWRTKSSSSPALTTKRGRGLREKI